MRRSRKKGQPVGVTIQSKPGFCPFCDGRHLVKRGLRKNSFRQLEIYLCRDCGKYFSSLAGLKGVKYPPRVIARALCLYHLGHSQEEAARRIRSEHRITVRAGSNEPSLDKSGQVFAVETEEAVLA